MRLLVTGLICALPGSAAAAQDTAEQDIVVQGELDAAATARR